MLTPMQTLSYFRQNSAKILYIIHKLFIIFQKNVSFGEIHGIMMMKVPDTPLIAMRTTSGRFDFRSFLCERRICQPRYLLMNR